MQINFYTMLCIHITHNTPAHFEAILTDRLGNLEQRYTASGEPWVVRMNRTVILNCAIPSYCDAYQEPVANRATPVPAHV